MRIFARYLLLVVATAVAAAGVAAVPARADTAKEALRFFKAVTDAANRYDESVVQYYADDAVSEARIIDGDGGVRDLVLRNGDVRVAVADGLVGARQLGYVVEYENIKVYRNGRRFKITSEFHFVPRIASGTYAMTIEWRSGEGWKIVREKSRIAEN